MKLRYSEAFYSVQGEGKFVGKISVSELLVVTFLLHELWTR